MSARKGQVMSTRISGRGRFLRAAMIDERDLHLFTSHNWTDNGCGYLASMERVTKKRLYLHRVIAGARDGQLVDHINGDTYDNRRCNLRIADKSLNAINNRKRADAFRFAAESIGGASCRQ